MVRRWRSRVLGGGMLAALAGAAGCTDDGVSLHVICPIAPEVSDEGCTWDSSSTTCVSGGVLNVASSEGYELQLKVESGLKSRARDVPPLGEPNGVQISSAEIELRSPGGDILGLNGNPGRTTATGYVGPGGVTMVSVNAIPQELIAQLTAEWRARFPVIVAVVKLHGKTNGQQEVETAEYEWPVRLTYVDPRPLTGSTCTPSAEYCQSLVGQDGFATVCTNVNDAPLVQ